MRSIHVLVTLALLTGGITVIPQSGSAQTPPPGYIWDLATVSMGAPIPSTYTQYSTSFVADNSSEYVSFAFREVPNYWAFDDASVYDNADMTMTNLLQDPGFESATVGQNCDDQGENSLGCPAGWGTWIQSVDTAAIGQVSSNADPYGCGNDLANSGTNFWCDGSVQGYDAIYQQLTALTVGDTYDISFYLAHDDSAPTNPPGVDALVYAGDQLPIGSISLATPEPASFTLLGAGLALIVAKYRRRRAQTD